MRIVYSKTKKGGRSVNEDVCGFVSNFAFVIDGATDVYNGKKIKEKDEVSWYVKKLKRELIENYDDGESLKNNLKKAINHLYIQLNTKNKLNGIKEYILPTFSIAMIKMCKKCFEYYILGDCYISYLRNGRPVIIRDERIEKFIIENRKKVLKKKKSKKDIYKETRKLANAINGYPIGSIRGIGLSKGKTGNINRNSNILLFSDGIIDYLNDNHNRIINLFDNKKIRNEMRIIDSYYNDKKKYKNSGRPKLNDDKTVMLVEQ